MAREIDKIGDILCLIGFIAGVVLFLKDYSKWFVLLCPLSLIIFIIKPQTICELL